MTHWYISFADDDAFLGGTVVEAESAEAALMEATSRGLNPGGEAAILEVPREVEDLPDFKRMRTWRERLLSWPWRPWISEAPSDYALGLAMREEIMKQASDLTGITELMRGYRD